ncbi:MAG: response regulator [Terracidiphilus sp.]
MKRVLIIDNAATVRMYHRGILESAGYAAEEAWNGIEALEKAIDAPFDLYVMDIDIPMLDGFGFLRRLHQQNIPQRPANHRNFNVIVRRNLLNHFDDASSTSSAEIFYEALYPGGYVCLGHSESLSRISSLFEVRKFPAAIIYRKHLEAK